MPLNFLNNGYFAGTVGIGTESPGTFLQLGTYNVGEKYINQATYPDIPSEHMMHITAPSTFSYYGGGISFGETAFTAANIVVRDAGAGGALDLCFGTGTATGVTEKMRIANDGNVGIGTTTPQSKLQVAHPGNRNGGSLLIGMNGSGTGKFSFLAGAHYDQATGSGNGTGSAGVALIGSFAGPSTNVVYVGGGPYEINAATSIGFWTNSTNLSTLGGSQRMNIANDGDIRFNAYGAGILVTDASGNITAEGGAWDGPYLPLSAGSSYPLTGDLYISKSTPALRLNDSGDNVPYELRVDGTTFSIKEVTNSRTLMSMTAGAVITLDSLASNTVINTTSAMVVPNGNVGIKTTLPANPLGINFAPNGISSITTSNNSTAWNTSSAIMLEGASNSNGLGFGVSGTANDRKSWIQSGHPDQQYASNLGTLAINPLGGNVGIGTTSPSEKLVVDGKVIINNANPPNNLAQLNIGYTGAAETRAIDIDGGWSGGESKSITFSYGSTSANMVGQISCSLISSTDTRLRFGKLYYNGDSSAYTMELKSTSLTTADLTVAGIVTATDFIGGSGAFLPLAGGTMTGTNGVVFPDDFKLNLGTGSDLEIYHDPGHSYITNNTGDLTIDSQGDDLILKSADDFLVYVQGTEIAIQATGNAGVKLRYNSSNRFETTTNGVAVIGSIEIDSALLSNQENTDVDTGTETVAEVSTAAFTAAFFDFVIKKTTNVRSGTVYACHDGAGTPLIAFTETSTQDLGDTSDVTLSVDISGGNMRLRATTTSDDWSIKSLIRAI